MRRRLPVIQPAPPAPPAPPASGKVEPENDTAIPLRPPWHWVGFGTVAIFAAWLPLAYVAQAVVARVLARRFGAAASAADIGAALGAMPAGERARLMAMLAVPNVVALGLSAFAGGYLVGRFGAGTTGREPASAGAMTAIVALVLALGAGTASGVTALVTAVVVILLCVGSAAWGGKVGARKRSPAA